LTLPPVLLVTATPGARGSEALAAALAVAAAGEQRAAIVVELAAAPRPRRPTLLASPAARRAEAALGGTGAGAAARGLVCSYAAGQGDEGLQLAAEALAAVPECCAWVIHLERDLWQPALEHPGLRASAALIRAELPRDRALASLAVRDLRARGLRVRIAKRPPGWAAGRRALAGVRIGGADEARLRRWTRTLLAAGRVTAGVQASAGGTGSGGIAETWLESGGALPRRTTSNWAIKP
jgi:hypothetical protein